MKMNKNLLVLAMSSVLAFLFPFLLCGCNNNAESSGGTEASADTTASSEETFYTSDDEWFDNSLDVYSATASPIVIKCEEPADAVAGGYSMWALGTFGAAVFQKHLYEDSAKCWDEIVYLTESGETKSVRIAEGLSRQVFGIGSIYGSSHYMIFIIEQSKDNPLGWSYSLAELNADMQEVRTIPIDFLSSEEYEFPFFILVDKEQNIHLVTDEFESGEWSYYIASSEGKLLQELNFGENAGVSLVTLQDGSVAIRTKDEVTKVDTSTGEKTRLKDLELSADYCTYLEQDKIIYATGKGIYVTELTGEKEKPLYLWQNHGINIAKVESIQACDNQGINVLYTDSHGHNFLHLEPTTQDIEIKKITLAVTAISKNMYQSAVTEFNKKYPAYRIEMKEYQYGDQKMLSELIAGNGPVLYDCDLMDFERQTKYFELLDDVLLQMGLEEDLIPEVMRIGEIDDRLYGIVSNFYIKTVLTGRDEPQTWNYEEFLKCIDNQNSLEGIFNGASLDDGLVFVTKFFMHGMEDNYLFDTESGTTGFDTEEFRKILQLGKQYQGKRCEFDKLMDGSLLCLSVNIDKPQKIAFIRALMGENANYIGYPAENGSGHYLAASSPLAVRASATEEERRVAHTFLKLLLSYETQVNAVNDVNFGMSVRKDVLDKQLQDINTFDVNYIMWMPQITLEEEQIDYEKDYQTLYALLQKATPEKKVPRELLGIIIEEVDTYFNGEADEEAVIRNLKNRVELYLSEQQ